MVFRVQKNRNYVAMSVHHLVNKNLSLGAKGLLSQMLSFPDERECTESRLAAMNKESGDVISALIHELTEAGYIQNGRIVTPGTDTDT